MKRGSLDILRKRGLHVYMQASTLPPHVLTQGDLLQKLSPLALENVSEHIIITNPHGKILYANKAAEKTTGYSREEMLDHTPVLWGGQMDGEFYKKLWHIISEEKKTFSGELTNRRKNGELYQAQALISPILDNDKNVLFYVGIERDITEAHAVEQAKSEFISFAAHQLQTPITTIGLIAEMLLKSSRQELASSGKKYLKELLDDIRKMSAIVETFLDISRIELGVFPIRIKKANIAAIANKAVKEFTSQCAQKRIHFIKTFGAVPVIPLDSQIVGIVIENLLSNAVKYTPARGTITLKLFKKGAYLYIECSDTGCGIAPKDQDKIFTKMFRANTSQKAKTKGTGLGLYVTKLLLEQTGGTIWFTSKEGKGTTFTARIPAQGMKQEKRLLYSPSRTHPFTP